MKYILTGLFLALSTLTFAQSNFVPGYVITDTKDSLSGYIDYKERSFNPISIDFKPTLASGVHVFSLKNCVALGIFGRETYQRFVVDISLNSDDINMLTVGADTSFKRDTVFLNVLQSGKNVTLYSYTDDLKTRFYIKETNNPEPIELIQRQYFRDFDSRNVVNDNRYTGQLLVVVKKYKAISPGDESKIKRTGFFKVDLVKVVGLINDQQISIKSKGGIRFFAGAGLNVNKVDYVYEDFARMNIKPSFLPYFTFGMDILPNKAIGRTIFRLGLSYEMNKVDAFKISLIPAKIRMSHTFTEHTFAISPQFIYNLYNADKLKIYAGAGASVNFGKYDILYSELNLLNNKTFIEKTQQFHNSVSFKLKTGIVLNKRIACELIYTVPYTTYVSTYKSSNLIDKGRQQSDVIYFQRYGVGVNYLLGKN